MSRLPLDLVDHVPTVAPAHRPQGSAQVQANSHRQGETLERCLLRYCPDLPGVSENRPVKFPGKGEAHLQPGQSDKLAAQARKGA